MCPFIHGSGDRDRTTVLITGYALWSNFNYTLSLCPPDQTTPQTRRTINSNGSYVCELEGEYLVINSRGGRAATMEAHNRIGTTAAALAGKEEGGLFWAAHGLLFFLSFLGKKPFLQKLPELSPAIMRRPFHSFTLWARLLLLCKVSMAVCRIVRSKHAINYISCSGLSAWQQLAINQLPFQLARHIIQPTTRTDISRSTIRHLNNTIHWGCSWGTDSD